MFRKISPSAMLCYAMLNIFAERRGLSMNHRRKAADITAYTGSVKQSVLNCKQPALTRVQRPTPALFLSRDFDL